LAAEERLAAAANYRFV